MQRIQPTTVQRAQGMDVYAGKGQAGSSHQAGMIRTEVDFVEKDDRLCAAAPDHREIALDAAGIEILAARICSSVVRPAVPRWSTLFLGKTRVAVPIRPSVDSRIASQSPTAGNSRGAVASKRNRPLSSTGNSPDAETAT
jgi:hypothetical protein